MTTTLDPMTIQQMTILEAANRAAACEALLAAEAARQKVVARQYDLARGRLAAQRALEGRDPDGQPKQRIFSSAPQKSDHLLGVEDEVAGLAAELNSTNRRVADLEREATALRRHFGFCLTLWGQVSGDESAYDRALGEAVDAAVAACIDGRGEAERQWRRQAEQWQPDPNLPEDIRIDQIAAHRVFGTPVRLIQPWQHYGTLLFRLAEERGVAFAHLVQRGLWAAGEVPSGIGLVPLS